MSAIPQQPGLIREHTATGQVQTILVTTERAKLHVVVVTLQTGKTLFPIQTRRNTHLSVQGVTRATSAAKATTLVVVMVLSSKTEIADNRVAIVSVPMAFDG